MHLFKSLWGKRSNFLIFFLSVASVFVAQPILRYGVNGVFYNIDPEMALIGNALSYIKNGLIHYNDHPGTPSIILIAYSYVPMRIYTKLFEHTNFIVWSFENLKYLFLYTRVVYIGMFSVSTYIFLKSINIFSKKLLVILFSFLLILSFSFTPKLAGTILSESLSFLLISIWLYLFSISLNKQSNLNSYLQLFVSGLAIANKYNSYPILLISILVLIFKKKIKISSLIFELFRGMVFVVVGFVLGTWQIRSVYARLMNQIITVFTQSGSAHGNGEPGFSIDRYIQSLKVVIEAEPVLFYSFLFVFLFMIFCLIFYRKRKFRLNREIFFYSVVTLMSILFIVKYPVTYYQFPNFILLTYLTSLFLDRLSSFLIICGCLLVLVLSTKNISNHLNILNQRILDSIYLEQFIDNHHTKGATLWDFGPSEDFMRIWIRGWGGGVFDKELIEKRPDLLELKSDYATVFIDNTNYKSVFNVCWDKLYIRENRALVFLDLYKDKKFSSIPIGDTGIWEIKSYHCFTKP